MGTFNNIFSEVKERLGGRTTIDSRITTWINDAYFDILLTPQFKYNELDFSTTFSTVASTRNYTTDPFDSIPTFWFILSLRNETTEREIVKKDIKEFDRYVHTEGEPVRYARFGGGIDLDPTPDAVYSILLRYRARPGELAVGDSTIIGREWDEPITLLATVKGYQALEQPAKAETALGLYQASMARREEAQSLEDMDKEPTFGVWYGRGSEQP